MSGNSKTLYGVIAVLVAIVIIVSSVGGLYYSKYSQVASYYSIYVSQLHQLGVKYTPNILIDYDNGTFSWYNDTSLAPGSNLYAATVLIMNGIVIASYSAEFGEHLVTGVGGVENTNTEFWWVWTFNATSSWQLAMVGVDELPITNGVVYAWTFCGMDSSGNPTCTP